MTWEQISDVLCLTDGVPLSVAGRQRVHSLVRMYTSLGDALCTSSYGDAGLRPLLSSRVSALCLHLLEAVRVSDGSASWKTGTPASCAFSASSPVSSAGTVPSAAPVPGACPESGEMLTAGAALEELCLLAFGGVLCFRGPLHDECRALAGRLVPRLLSGGGAEDEVGALTCILCTLGSASGDVSSLDWVRLYLGVCRRWVSEMVPGSASSDASPVPVLTDSPGVQESPSPWPGVPAELAVRRLGLLLDGVHVFGGRTLAAPAEALYASLRTGLCLSSALTPGDVPLACAWHELLCSPWCPPQDTALRRRLSSLMEGLSLRTPPLSELWHACIAPAVCDGCESLLREGFPKPHGTAGMRVRQFITHPVRN